MLSSSSGGSDIAHYGDDGRGNRLPIRCYSDHGRFSWPGHVIALSAKKRKLFFDTLSSVHAHLVHNVALLDVDPELGQVLVIDSTCKLELADAHWSSTCTQNIQNYFLVSGSSRVHIIMFNERNYRSGRSRKCLLSANGGITFFTSSLLLFSQTAVLISCRSSFCTSRLSSAGRAQKTHIFARWHD